MTDAQAAEMVAKTQARALEAIAEVAARQTPETILIKALAEVTILDRLARGNVIGTTKSGRLIVEMTGEASEAELKLREITS